MSTRRRTTRIAPLYTRAYDLYSWLLDHAARLDDPCAKPLLEYAQVLLDAVCLAVESFDTDHQLRKADEAATLLRTHLRVAAARGHLSDRQLLHANGMLREIGRQIGGWHRQRTGVVR
ncbi:MAG: four helix bundle protein [Acidobacteriota bacterium]